MLKIWFCYFCAGYGRRMTFSFCTRASVCYPPLDTHGKMGGNLALQAMEKNVAEIGKAQGPKRGLERNVVKVVDDYGSFVSYLDKPRVIFLPAGPTVDNVLKEVLPYLEKGDVVMDGGNSFYLDS